jgi:nucleoside-diphosphate-sugar epimerase
VKALVTGGGGFLGGAIVRQLVARGAKVRAFSRRDYPALQALGVEQRMGDLADARAVAAAAEGCDIVFHAAAKAGIWGLYEEYHRANVTGTENIIAACRKCGIKRLVHTSSPSVVFDGEDMEGVDESVPYAGHFEANYPKTKALAEQLVRGAAGRELATVCLRPHLIWGPGDNHLLPRLVARAKTGQLRRIGRRRTMIDTVYVDNAAEAHLLAADRLSPGGPISGRAYFISQGEPKETWEMINLLLEAAGAPPVEKSIPRPAALALAWCFETVHRLSRNPGEPRLTRFVVNELCTAHWFDIGAARRELGYAPSVSIAEGLRRLKIHWQGANSRGKG